MPSAEIITIGTEILLGEIVDTNAPFLARRLRDAGIDLYRKTSVGDNVARIAAAIQEAMQRCEIIITTGGLGPTVDDPTREAVALALGVSTEFRPELWKQIRSRFARFGRLPTENNKRQAYVPATAIAVENPVGTAPAFIIERADKCIFSLPGVPREMEYLMDNSVMPYLRGHYQLDSVIKSRVIHTAGAGESQIDELIAHLETLTNPTVGLAAHSGQVDVRITAKAGSESQADDLIQPIEEEIRQLLSEWVFGADQELLEDVAARHLAELGWKVSIVVDRSTGDLLRRMAAFPQVFSGGQMISETLSPDRLALLVQEYAHESQAQVGLGVAIYPRGEKQDIELVLVTPAHEDRQQRPYGGPPQLAQRWAVNHSLNLLRNIPAQ